MIALLLSCTNPISNDVFLADADYAAALPSAERLGFPGALRTLPVQGDEPLLQSAQAAAERLEPSLTLLVTLAQVLRSSPPSERGSTHRLLGPRSTEIDGRSVWVRASLSRPDEGEEVRWTLEGATGVSGPWAVWGDGVHRGDEGDVDWTFVPASELLQRTDLLPALAIHYDHVDADNRLVDLAVPGMIGFPEQYVLAGQSAFAFTATLTLQPDAPHPGVATLLMAQEGGYAEGELALADGNAPFSLCWNGSGDRVFYDGPDVSVPEGSPSACPTIPSP